MRYIKGDKITLIFTSQPSSVIFFFAGSWVADGLLRLGFERKRVRASCKSSLKETEI
jgi:hypothetical protein